MIENEKDRKYLDSLPEVERESILAERFEKLKNESTKNESAKDESTKNENVKPDAADETKNDDLRFNEVQELVS